MEKYYTWKESAITSGMLESMYEDLSWRDQGSISLSTAYTTLTSVAAPSWLTGENNKYYKELTNRLFRYTSDERIYFMCIDDELDETDIDSACYKRWYKMFEDIKTSGDEIIPLIKAVEDNIDKVMDEEIVAKVKATSKFNDTPQQSGDFNNDNHISNITTNEQESNSPSGSIAQKINNMQLMLIDYYELWLRRLVRYIIY